MSLESRIERLEDEEPGRPIMPCPDCWKWAGGFFDCRDPADEVKYLEREAWRAEHPDGCPSCGHISTIPPVFITPVDRTGEHVPLAWKPLKDRDEG